MKKLIIILFAILLLGIGCETKTENELSGQQSLLLATGQQISGEVKGEIKDLQQGGDNDQTTEIEELKKNSVSAPVISKPKTPLPTTPKEEVSKPSDNVSINNNVEGVEPETKRQENLATEKSEENFIENLISMYAKSAEDLRRTIESHNIDIVDLEDRRDELERRVNIIEGVHFTDDGGNGSILNQMFDLYQKHHEREIDYINRNFSSIKANLDLLSGWLKEYNASVSSLQSNPNKIITRSYLIDAMQHESNTALPTISSVKKNIVNALINHYQSVINFENAYSESAAIIENGLAKITESEDVSDSYYQPMPQSSAGLTARQELLLNPIQCTINYDAYQTNVSCY